MITNLLNEEIAKKFKLNANFNDEEFKRLARKENLTFNGDMSKTVRRIRDAVHSHNDSIDNYYTGIKVILDDPVNIKSNILERLNIAKEQNDEEKIKEAEEELILKDYFTTVAKLEGKAVREVLEEKTKLKLEKESEPITQEEPISEEPKQEEQKTEVKEMIIGQNVAEQIHNKIKAFSEEISKKNRKADPKQKLENITTLKEKVEVSIRILQENANKTTEFKKANRYLNDKSKELDKQIRILREKIQNIIEEPKKEELKEQPVEETKQENIKTIEELQEEYREYLKQELEEEKKEVKYFIESVEEAKTDMKTKSPQESLEMFKWLNYNAENYIEVFTEEDREKLEKCQEEMKEIIKTLSKLLGVEYIDPIEEKEKEIKAFEEEQNKIYNKFKTVLEEAEELSNNFDNTKYIEIRQKLDKIPKNEYVNKPKFKDIIRELVEVNNKLIDQKNEEESKKQINKDVFNEEDIKKYNLKPNISDEEQAQILENDIKEFNRASTMTPERKEFLKWEIQRLLIECNITIGEDRYYELRQRFIRIAKQKYNEEINYNRTEIQKMNLLSIFEKNGLKIKNDFYLDLLREIRVIENFEKGLGKEVKIIEKIPQKTILMLPAPNQERTAQKIESINNCKQIIEDCFKEIRELPIENQNIDPEDWRIIRAVNLEKKPLEKIPEIIEIFRNACNSENIEEQNKIFDQLLKIFEDHYEKIRQPFSKKLRIFKRAFLKMLRILEISKSNRICLKKHIFIDTSKIQNNACLTNTQEVLKENIQNTEIEENKGIKTSLQVINNITRIQENPKQPDKIKHTFKLLRTLRKENKKVAKTMKKTLRYILREATKKRIIKGV